MSNRETAPLTEEEFKQLVVGDTVLYSETERTVLWVFDSDDRRTVFTSWDTSDWAAWEKSEVSRLTPTGATLDRLRPIPEEAKHWKTLRSFAKESGDYPQARTLLELLDRVKALEARL